MKQDLILKAEEILKKADNAVIALIDGTGCPRASMISSMKTEGINHAWFATGLSSGKVRCIKSNNKASLCYSNGSDNVTLMGTVEILTDADIKKDIWVDWFINHFPGGISDPDYCVLKFTAEKAVFWVDYQHEEFSL